MTLLATLFSRKHDTAAYRSLVLSRVKKTADVLFSSRESQPEQENLRLADRAFIPTSEVIDTLETLAGTLIFNTATREERLALASRLRRWVVEDGTYLIREGDGDRNQSAIFMIGELPLAS